MSTANATACGRVGAFPAKLNTGRLQKRLDKERTRQRLAKMVDMPRYLIQ